MLCQLAYSQVPLGPPGPVVTIAGTGLSGFADGIGTAASFSGPWGVALDVNGTFALVVSARRFNCDCERTLSTAALHFP